MTTGIRVNMANDDNILSKNTMNIAGHMSGTKVQNTLGPDQQQAIDKQATDKHEIQYTPRDDFKATEESSKVQEVYSKIMSGQEVTPEEKELLKNAAPDLYQKVALVEQEREMVKQRLEMATTQEEVRMIESTSMSMLLGASMQVQGAGDLTTSEKIDKTHLLTMRMKATSDEINNFKQTEEFANMSTGSSATSDNGTTAATTEVNNTEANNTTANNTNVTRANNTNVTETNSNNTNATEANSNNTNPTMEPTINILV
ncbi:MAG: hypothetical protein ATN34_00885 [Epulopiscium sp. Nele67-Bin002]|nr:MAG: hypothetical protein BEN18_07030 [Epulopiscium sp. Nuni2H_MBin001]OON90914.1 MAG: hypothetical protein ATN34_00885 [Epulopiscium sp. Nele67-Bin002]